MSSLRFHCAICGTGLSATEESAGKLLDCPSCQHTVPVPARLPARPGAIEGLPLLPGEILALEIKFLCPDCRAKLRIDARLEGLLVDCPKCTHRIRIPHWSTAPAPSRPTLAARAAELTEAEIEFLSSPPAMNAPQTATAGA
jgi:DNA-directed RNA polymerase subunit RPC12/RpoP